MSNESSSSFCVCWSTKTTRFQKIIVIVVLTVFIVAAGVGIPLGIILPNQGEVADNSSSSSSSSSSSGSSDASASTDAEAESNIEGDTTTDTSTSSTSSCSAGFTITNGSCLENTCPCSNGTPAAGINCPDPLSATCSACNSGYTLDAPTKLCAENVCPCDNGTPSTGTSCPVLLVETCQACNVGYTLDASNSSSACIENSCPCTNGAPATGASCLDPTETKCSSCDQGFTGSTCQDMGLCVTGVPISLTNARYFYTNGPSDPSDPAYNYFCSSFCPTMTFLVPNTAIDGIQVDDKTNLSGPNLGGDIRIDFSNAPATPATVQLFLTGTSSVDEHLLVRIDSDDCILEDVGNDLDIPKVFNCSGLSGTTIHVTNTLGRQVIVEEVVACETPL